jgi:hypothetical protein
MPRRLSRWAVITLVGIGAYPPTVPEWLDSAGVVIGLLGPPTVDHDLRLIQVWRRLEPAVQLL